MLKKVLFLILLLLLFLCMLASCDEECRHSFAEVSIEKAPTCSEYSKVFYECSKCGFSYTEERLEHNYIESVYKEPTCYSKGDKYYVCADCGHVDDVVVFNVIPTLEHEFTDATCTEAQKCSVCGATGEGPLGHTFVTKEAVSATCTTTGHTAGTMCQVCSEVLSGCEEIAKNAHSTRFGICSECDQPIMELLPEAKELLSKLGITTDAINKASEQVTYATSLTVSRIPAELNIAFSYLAPAEDALKEAYVIADAYDEFSNLKSDLETLYGIAIYIQGLQATSSNFLSVAYDFIDASSLYIETLKTIQAKLEAYIPYMP